MNTLRDCLSNCINCVEQAYLCCYRSMEVLFNVFGVHVQICWLSTVLKLNLPGREAERNKAQSRETKGPWNLWYAENEDVSLSAPILGKTPSSLPNYLSWNQYSDLLPRASPPDATPSIQMFPEFPTTFLSRVFVWDVAELTSSLMLWLTVGMWLSSVARGLNKRRPCTVMECIVCAIVSLKFRDKSYEM